jgi:hypothetical protein
MKWSWLVVPIILCTVGCDNPGVTLQVNFSNSTDNTLEAQIDVQGTPSVSKLHDRGHIQIFFPAAAQSTNRESIFFPGISDKYPLTSVMVSVPGFGSDTETNVPANSILDIAVVPDFDPPLRFSVRDEQMAVKKQPWCEVAEKLFNKARTLFE